MKKVEDMVIESTNLIEKDELYKLQGLVGEFNKLQMSLGEFELQKATLLNAIFTAKSDLDKFQGELKDKYGNILINIQNGEFKENTNEPNS